MQQRRYLSISNNYYLEFSGLFEVENIIENAFSETICSVLNIITNFHSVRDAALGKNASRFQGLRIVFSLYAELRHIQAISSYQIKAAATKTDNTIQEETEDITSYFCTQKEKCLVVIVQITSMLQLKVQNINSFHHIITYLEKFVRCFFYGFNSKDFIHIFSAKI